MSNWKFCTNRYRHKQQLSACNKTIATKWSTDLPHALSSETRHTMPMSKCHFYCLASFVSMFSFSTTHASATDWVPFGSTFRIRCNPLTQFYRTINSFVLLSIYTLNQLSVSHLLFCLPSSVQEFPREFIPVTILLTHLFLFLCLPHHAQTGDPPVQSRLELGPLLPMASRLDAQPANLFPCPRRQRGQAQHLRPGHLRPHQSCLYLLPISSRPQQSKACPMFPPQAWLIRLMNLH